MKRSARWLAALALALGAHVLPLRLTAPPPVGHPVAPAPRTTAVRLSVPPAPPGAAPTVASVARRPTQRPAAPSRAPAPPPPWFIEPAPVVLWYQLVQGATVLDMRFTWAPERGRYRADLETLAASGRGAAWLRSAGNLGPDGLSPHRYTEKSSRRSEQALTMVREPDHTEVAFSTTEQRLPAPDDVQDGLSWLPHWLGRWRATGQSTPLQVAQADGRVAALQLAVDPTDAWHWSSPAAQAGDDAVELWLSPTPPHWPLRWRRTTPWGQVTEWRATLNAP